MSPRPPLSPFTGGRGRSEKIPPGVWTQCSHTTWRSPQPAKVLYVADQLWEMARPAGEAPDPWIKPQARLGRRPWLRGGRSQAQFLHSDQLSRRDPPSRQLHMLAAQPGPTPYLELFLPEGLGSGDTMLLRRFGPSRVPRDRCTPSWAPTHRVLCASQHPRPVC